MVQQQGIGIQGINRLTRQLSHGTAYDLYVDADAGKFLFTRQYNTAVCRRGTPRLASIKIDFTAERVEVLMKYVNVPAAAAATQDAGAVFSILATLLGQTNDPEGNDDGTA